jgi:hypothetical protein
VALVRVPFYFINPLPTSLLYISILLTYAEAPLLPSYANGDNQKLLRTYKDWVFRNKRKAEAGMKHSKVTPFSPAKGAAAGSD